MPLFPHRVHTGPKETDNAWKVHGTKRELGLPDGYFSLSGGIHEGCTYSNGSVLEKEKEQHCFVVQTESARDV